jgi:hypothetical protein
MLTDIFKRDVPVVRPGSGGWLNGYWVDGVESNFVIRANVQPVPAIVMETFPEGYRTKSAFILYTNTELNTSEDNLNKPDVVMLYGKKYLVTKKEIWGSTELAHYEIIVFKGELDAN